MSIAYIILSNISSDVPLPASLSRPCTVRNLVSNHLDINGIPRRYFFELLSYFTTDDLEREKFQEFNSPAGQVW